jgi:hypothetical protein
MISGPPESAAIRDPGSFRDPAGFVYRREGRVLRQVNRWYQETWSDLEGRGFLGSLVADDLLLPFKAANLDEAADPTSAIAVLQPEALPFISYPYEWTFGELRDAALLTLRVQQRSMAQGVRLRDASAYNVQFRDGRPILIDHLSFEPAPPTEPWPAYRQFCEHFLAPLALMARRDPRCSLLLRDFIDGIPLDLTASLLPVRTRFSVGLGSHIHLHARQKRIHADDVGTGGGGRRMSRTGADALLDSLVRTVSGLRWEPAGTEWAEYAETDSYSSDALDEKERVVRAWLERERPSVVWDLGANVGRFSRLAADTGARVVAWDVDHGAAERLYRRVRESGSPRILPLVVDLLDPTPALGWAGRERRSLEERADADMILALALVHHLAISGNVPLGAIAGYFARLAPSAVVEFVPASDPMAQRLLANRGRVFEDYSIAAFRSALGLMFEIEAETTLTASDRTLFLLRRR